ncbi:MAG TPA: hypothetical protein PLO63_15100 [Syntrophales bacterium]|jgi:PBP1b-binding outer membrane lipoprotein LpoB|nr:hypothetical protein [Syntrophales bacterium]
MKKWTILSMLLLLLLLILSGCAPKNMYWYNSGKDMRSAKTDKFECEEAAVTYSRDMGQAGNTDMIDQRIRECMEIRGYVHAPEEEIPAGSFRVK